MILKLSSLDIILPTEYDIVQRLEFVDFILEEHKSEFEYIEKPFDIKNSRKIDTNRHIKTKLDILATYLINCEPCKDKTIISKYQEKMRIKRREVPFSSYNGEVLNINGWG